jgi:hypothetical protein
MLRVENCIYLQYISIYYQHRYCKDGQDPQIRVDNILLAYLLLPYRNLIYSCELCSLFDTTLLNYYDKLFEKLEVILSQGKCGFGSTGKYQNVKYIWKLNAKSFSFTWKYIYMYPYKETLYVWFISLQKLTVQHLKTDCTETISSLQHIEFNIYKLKVEKEERDM